MKTQYNLFISIFFLALLSIIYSAPINLPLNEAIKGSLADKTYSYYKLKLPELEISDSKFLLIEARRNVDQDVIDNVFSNPNLFISSTEVYPSPDKNTWSSDRFGDEIISINEKHVKSGAIFYISIYCEFKCNYILDAKLYDNYQLKEDKIYTVSMIADDVLKGTFKSRKNFDILKVNCVSFKMKPFRIFLAKKDPSSSNTAPSSPIFTNGYYFLMKKGDPFYEVDQEYEILIENKGFKQDLLFWIQYDEEDIELSEMSPLFGVASPDFGNCYYFNIDKMHQNKNIVISTTIFNGNGYIKIGGWEKVKEMKVKKEDKDTYPIISDKSILLTETNFKTYGDFIKEQSKDLHFCFIATDETSYLIKVYYQENSEKAQALNYLLPGVSSDDILPGKNVTKYRIFYFEENKDIKVDLKVKNGSPKLYIYFSYEDNVYIDKNKLKTLIDTKDGNLTKVEEIYYRNYQIKINKFENPCSLKPYDTEGKECKIFAIIDCEKDTNCLYELLFDHIGDVIIMKPKVLYSNVVRDEEKDKYQIRITDDNIKNFAVILTQNTGNLKLILDQFSTESGLIDFEGTEQFNKNYMPNIIEIKAKDFPGNSIKGIFDIEVEGIFFSSYNIYYYTFDDDHTNKLDHKTISMPLIKGNIIQDYIKRDHYIKVYSYDNSNIGRDKIDLFIYLHESSWEDYTLYIFKDLNDYSYENEKVKGYVWSSKYTNYIHIEKTDPNYIVGNLYIMVFLRKYEDKYSQIVYRKDEDEEAPYLLVVTDEFTPLTLIEGVEFRQYLTDKRPFQTFLYNHRDIDDDFILSISIPYSKIKLGIKIGDKDYIYEKIINGDYNLKVDSEKIMEYCPSSKSCNIELRVEATNLYDLDFAITLLCKSSQASIVYLTKNGQIEKRTILNYERQYFIVEANPSPGMPVNIIAVFTYGKGDLFAKKAKKNEIVEQYIFPNEEDYEYSSDLNINEEISVLTIPYEDIKDEIPCRILVTVKGKFKYLGRNQGEYSISISNVVDDIFPNKNYRLLALKGSIKYYHFTIKGQKKRLSISMTNKEVDSYMYLNYGTLNKNMNDFQWKSQGSYNEYIDITANDPFFVSRKIYSLEGDYYLAIRSLKDTYFNLFISDSDVKIMTISENFPGTCMCDKEGELCYFRYENINSPDIAQVIEQEMVFYFDFTYGSAEIYASLFQNGNNGIILQNLPTQYKKDYKSLYSNDYLKIHLLPDNKKYTLDSVIILTTKCKSKALFDFNVRPIIRGGELIKSSEGIFYLNMDKDNVFYISKNTEKKIKFTYYSTINNDITFEAQALEGSAQILCYVNNDANEVWDDDAGGERIAGYKRLSEFSVDKGDTHPHFDSITKENSFRQNLYFEINAKTDCLFSIFLHYSNEVLSIPMSKQIQGQFSNSQFFAYIELLPEYEQIIFTLDKMHSNSQYSIFAKTSVVNNLNFKMMMSYSSPSRHNFDMKATTNKFTNSVSMKFKNLPKEKYELGKKVIVMLLIVPENTESVKDKLNMIAHPNVDHYEIIYPQPNKYIYSSLSSKRVDKTVFKFKQQEKDQDLLVVEISACQGNFWYELTKDLANQPIVKKSTEQDSYLIQGKGKKMIITNIEENIEYYLHVFGIKEDEMLFGNINNTTDIDFLLYYYTTNRNDFDESNQNSKITYELKDAGNIVLKLPNLENINSKNNKIKLDDLTVSLVLTENSHEFEYMDSICYLSKKIEIIESQNLYKNYSININKKKNEIEINKLDTNKNYYLNVLITNKKTGQIYALDPLQIMPNKGIVSQKRTVIIVLVIGIVILFFVIFYFYRKYRIATAIVNYEKNDIKNMGSIPKSITELKKMQEEKNKQAKEKYNSLTEDSGEI